MRVLVLLGVLCGAGLPVAVAFWLTDVAIGRGPVATVGLLAVSAAVNSLWPLGGGNIAVGTFCLRFAGWEWTVDGDRHPWRARLSAVVMAALVSGSFVLWAPLLARAWRMVPTRPGLDELMALAGVAGLVLAAWLTHKPELPLWKMVAEVEQAEANAKAVAPPRLRGWVRALQRLARPDGGVGHVGGIGVLTPGLHEVLAAERLLRSAAAAGIPEAAPLHARCLDYVAAQALPGGGFPAYPGGGGRVWLTVEAVGALGARVSPAERSAHRAFIESCRLPSGRFGRSPGGPPSSEDTQLAERFLAQGG